MGAMHQSRCLQSHFPNKAACPICCRWIKTRNGCRGPRSSAEDAALGEAMVASKREEMDREIDHLLIMQSENLRRYWEVRAHAVCCVCCLETADDVMRLPMSWLIGHCSDLHRQLGTHNECPMPSADAPCCLTVGKTPLNCKLHAMVCSSKSCAHTFQLDGAYESHKHDCMDRGHRNGSRAVTSCW